MWVKHIHTRAFLTYYFTQIYRTAEACLGYQRAVTVQQDSSNWHESLSNTDDEQLTREMEEEKNHSHAIRSTAATTQSSFTFLPLFLFLIPLLSSVSKCLLFYLPYIFNLSMQSIYICSTHTHTCVWLWVLSAHVVGIFSLVSSLVFLVFSP